MDLLNLCGASSYHHRPLIVRQATAARRLRSAVIRLYVTPAILSISVSNDSEKELAQMEGQVPRTGGGSTAMGFI
jgi:hypothetical protein